MIETPFKSNAFWGRWVRNAILIVALLCAWLANLGAKEDLWLAFTYSAFCLGLFYLYHKSRRLMGEVVADEDGLEIVQAGRRFRLEWTDLTGLRSLILFGPPIYRLTYGPAPSVTYFVPPPITRLNLGFTEFKIGPMGRYIEAKCKEAGNVIWVRLS